MPALLCLVAASLPMELDPAVHNIAVAAAGNELHMDGASRAIAASIATLCVAAFILATGSLGDRQGRKRNMLLGLAVSMIGGRHHRARPPAPSCSRSAASFRASVSPRPSASPSPCCPAIAAEPAALARAVARWLALQAIGIIVLCMLGGYLAGVSWRLAYLLSPAVAAAAFLCCLRMLPEAKAADPGRSTP